MGEGEPKAKRWLIAGCKLLKLLHRHGNTKQKQQKKQGRTNKNKNQVAFELVFLVAAATDVHRRNVKRVARELQRTRLQGATNSPIFIGVLHLHLHVQLYVKQWPAPQLECQALRFRDNRHQQQQQHQHQQQRQQIRSEGECFRWLRSAADSNRMRTTM